jgi:methyltransferase (TIGR00027 family)
MLAPEAATALDASRGPAAITSAETVAALRAAVAKERSLLVPCRDPFARHFLGLKHRLLTGLLPGPLLRRIIERISPGSYCFAITRTRHFDSVLLGELQAGIEQVVLLGAGYDSRAWRFAEAMKRASAVVYEVDHPGTQGRKRRILARRLRQAPPNVVYLPVDFNRQSIPDALLAAGFSPERPAVFLWEGVSYYLPRSVVAGVLEMVGASASGSSIAFDYALARFVAGDQSTYGGREVARWLARIKEPFLFGLDPHETPAFLAERGLRLVSDLGPEELERAYLGTRGGPALGKTLGHIRIVHARAGATRAPYPT